jgi:hypothetical protein
LCYGVKLNDAFFPVAISNYETIPADLRKNAVITYDLYPRKKSIDHRAMKKIIVLYNTFVITESEKQRSFRIGQIPRGKSGLLARELRIIPVYPLIKIEKLLIHKKNIIGFISNKLYYYISEVSLSKEKSLIDYMKKNYDITDENLDKYYLKYDPVDIDTTINNYLSKPAKPFIPATHLLNEGLYNKQIYNLFVLEFISYFDKDRNASIRRQLSSLINKTNFRNINFDDFDNQLEKFVIQSDDLIILKSQVNNFYNTHFNKKQLLSEISDTFYHFDRVSLINLQNIAKLTDTQNVKDKLIKEITKISKKIVKIGIPDYKKELKNIFIPCKFGADGSYCRSNKLVISAKKLKEIIELLADDMVNPIKQKYIWSAIFIGNIINYFEFNKKENEEIYVRFD